MLFITTYTNAQEGGLILGDPVQEKPKQSTPSIEEGEFDLKEQPVVRSKNTSLDQKNTSTLNTSEQNSSSNAIRTEVMPNKKPAVTEEKKQVQEDEESVLTFNFLYYIIQKFKFDEVIDQ